MKPTPALMWGTATLMVTIVSCCSLVGVSIMPLISGPFYKSSITLFTGLAVGSLLGSAIFSLIPQAFSLHLQADKAYLWKSLVIFFGIYMFYLSERLMRIYFERKERKNSDLQLQEQVQLKRNKSNQDDLGDNKHQAGDSSDTPNSSGGIQLRSHDKATKDHELSEISLARNQPSDQVESILAHGHQHSHSHSHSSVQPHEVIRKALKGEKINGTSVARRAAQQIAPVAWMIIIGDGLHNFIDGLSIGAAFTESIYQGMIICIAVIFEELPHELGDFAVLIASGMTVRQALGFNFLSACTCYIGMIFGIVLGDIAQSASFIFALAAGMFFYISLVDMMGELSAALEECKGSTRESIHMLVMQNIGILTGIIIIFSLSLFGPAG